MRTCDREYEEGVISGTRKCAPKPKEFSILVDSRYARSGALVVWQNIDYCPTQDLIIFGNRPRSYLPYYDYCGSYNISAGSFQPLPVTNCSVKSDVYPIPNWVISRRDNPKNVCTIDKTIYR